MINDELKRLMNNNVNNYKIDQVFLTRFEVQCNGNSKGVLNRVKDVLEIVLQQDVKRWLTVEEWKCTLPKWFIESCADEITQEEAEQRLTLSLEERIKISKNEGWALSSWIYWLNPNEKQWYWWESNIIDENILIVTVQSEDYPFAWGALEWLLLASGAIKVEEL
ncbi:hypothetical protein NNC19_12735 [Clostridium sp. SHJSY1]|uniref:hypothetical protein n=1 Tax=Clostridium sp. SHJSY1 TaxID=2942483 RepID=UPI002874EDC9|nr:hypothetical protein [Clostridium sp. SHJSY1]MDS0526550.1 hypothetical protein [Clostridium sp. SHJSY1]